MWKGWTDLIRCCSWHSPSINNSWLLSTRICTWLFQIFDYFGLYSLLSSLLKWWALTIKSCHRFDIAFWHHHLLLLSHIFRMDTTIAFRWSSHRFTSTLPEITLLSWILREVHELYFVSLRNLTQLVNIVVEVEKSLINLHLFFLLLFLQLFLFFKHGLFSFLLCDYFRFICLWALSFLYYIQELKSFHRIHNTKIPHTLLFKLCLHYDFLINRWRPSFFKVVTCISHDFLILFTLIMTLFAL